MPKGARKQTNKGGPGNEDEGIETIGAREPSKHQESSLTGGGKGQGPNRTTARHRIIEGRGKFRKG